MSLRHRALRLFEHCVGHPYAERVGRRVLTDRLRILAYHDVPDRGRFEAQIRHLVDRYTPVSARDVVAAVHEDRPLPPSPVWVTFDDGHPEVVEHGQEVLDRYGVQATVFVCPGFVDQDRAFWWTVVRRAVAEGVAPHLDEHRRRADSMVGHLKVLPDDERRTIVAACEAALAERGIRVRARQLRAEQLHAWVAAGHDVGNHTWDHPCLDRCSPATQASQVERADEWLQARVPGYTRVFAYPNGNGHAAAGVTSTLARLGYALALGFDHRLATVDQPPFALSRLRVSADADLPRFRAIVSGVHSGAFTAASRFRRLPSDEGRGLSPSSPPAGRR